ncbi:cytochrome P450 [Pseudomaricurvus sp. HS19]|uniref:cytochrome P450 n=1 Tax=Pseudomaricurvus sp. HS19 TaxID=2692626 RepID=UPI00136DEABB|nr:cytochrome P450 [Pseudomaricurvus sp. HS19]MYM64011.1 cytochrome P450 [Pseudomaricurvus sp. HS19]
MRSVQATESLKPDHVPEELYRDIDIHHYTAELDDPYKAGERLLQGPDIFWSPMAANGHPGWVLTRYQHIMEAYGDPDHFSSERSDLAAMGVQWKLNPLEFDPPQHHKYRRLLNPMFSPKSVAEMEKPVCDVCEELLAPLLQQGRCEFIGDFAEKFPSYIFLDLMGMPRSMLPDFLEWERLLLRAEDPRQRAGALLSVIGFLDKFVDEQMQNPTTEVMRGIVTAEYEGERRLTKEEIMGMVTLLYIGGLDTVYSTLGWIFRHLAENPELQTELCDNPDKIPAAVEEFLRLYPVAMPHRRLKADLEFHGVKMKKGDYVLMATFAAHRDPDSCDHPHQFDMSRRPRHFTFAAGPHLCLGVHLAKRELRTVIAEFLQNCNNIRLVEGEAFDYHTGGTWGVDRLMLEWDPA